MPKPSFYKLAFQLLTEGGHKTSLSLCHHEKTHCSLDHRAMKIPVEHLISLDRQAGRS